MYRFQFDSAIGAPTIMVRARDAAAAIRHVERHCPGLWDCVAQYGENGSDEPLMTWPKGDADV